jgi:hypothetical protein
MIANRQVPLPDSFIGGGGDPVRRVCNRYGAALFSQECRFIKVQKKHANSCPSSRRHKMLVACMVPAYSGR